MQHESRNTLKNKNVLILGGSVGIGLATAKAAAQEGAMVTVVSSNRQRIDKALEALPTGSKGFVINLTHEAAIKDFFEDYGTFDHLVFTAGENLQIQTLADMAVTDAKKFFELRYWGVFAAVKYAAPHINAGGSITLTGGAAGIKSGKGWVLGASICSAMEGFTRTMAVELAPLRVNIVVPGMVRTNLWDNIPEADREAMYQHTAAVLPVQYVAEADDIALSYIHLMRQPYITGQRIVVDGGYIL